MSSEPSTNTRQTLSNFLVQQQRINKSQALPDELLSLIGEISVACKQLSHLVTQGALAGVLGAAGTENIQGEDQKKLDVIANDVFIDSLVHSGLVAGLASEEMEHMFPMPEGSSRGRYLVTFDPLDGSSNIDVNGSVGTIFSVLDFPNDEAVSDQAFLQQGARQVCAGYCLYSSASMLVLTTGQGVNGFTLDSTIGEFLLTHPAMEIPAETSEFAINASYQRHWQTPVSRYIEEVLQGTEGSRGKNFNMRWAGSMVGDVHRILCRGGVFMYPLDMKMLADDKQGKLRLLYEANPMGMLVEQAGGIASLGNGRILALEPSSLHQRVPVIMGSRDEVEYIEQLHQQAAS